MGLIPSDKRHCLRVRYRTHRPLGNGSGTRPLDTDSRGPVPDPEPRQYTTDLSHLHREDVNNEDGGSDVFSE